MQGQFSPLNSPGNRKYNGLTWVDNEGNFWLYGGNNGYDTKSDLWKYDPVINQWAWINGSQLSGNPPVKNTYQTFDPANSPSKI
ncbi:MAG: hypothetical protein IPG39_11825 [Bacteroidetes bacterium]|nr:hypothetical protein [Bacteroidota bacterium]